MWPVDPLRTDFSKACAGHGPAPRTVQLHGVQLRGVQLCGVQLSLPRPQDVRVTLSHGMSVATCLGNGVWAVELFGAVQQAGSAQRGVQGCMQAWTVGWGSKARALSACSVGMPRCCRRGRARAPAPEPAGRGAGCYRRGRGPARVSGGVRGGHEGPSLPRVCVPPCPAPAHARRSLLPMLAEWLCKEYRSERRAARLVRGLHLYLVPSMNPDGFAKRHRGNACVGLAGWLRAGGQGAGAHRRGAQRLRRVGRRSAPAS
jgi:hypothetical protein